MNAAAAAAGSAAASWPGLACLRPYAARRTTAMTTTTQRAYVHLYQTVCSLRRKPSQACSNRPLSSMAAVHAAAAVPGRRRTQKQRRAAAAAAAAGDDATAADTAAEARSLVALRIRELEAAGARVYPRYEPQAERLSVAAFCAEFGGVAVEDSTDDPSAQARRRVELSGRVLSVHRLGAKLFFLRLLDEGAQVQVMCNLRGVATETTEGAADPEAAAAGAAAAFKTAARLLQRGDHVAVTGRAVRTAAQGELTLAADALPRVYAPALAPLPGGPGGAAEKGSVLHRSVALLTQPGAAATLRLRARLLQTLRGFLEQRRFVEVQTPVLAAGAGGAAARPFLTRRGGAVDAEDDAAADAAYANNDAPPLSLRIAPELWLKRLVVGGLDRVYEIGPAFRNEGIDTTHNPEFTMCEFYAAYWTLPRLMAETERLLAALADAAAAFRAEASGSGSGSGSSDLPPADALDVMAPFARVAFVPGLEAALGFALPDLDAPDAYAQLRARLEEAGHGHDAAEDGGDGTDRLAALLDRLAGQHLESQAPPGRPLFVTHHPACLSPLAKTTVCAQTGQRVAARAELFVGGRELANMYEEENDPAAQRQKMAAQAAGAGGAGGAAAVDEHYLAALETGLPPTGGWGCGVERLVMLFAGQRRIAECLSFGTLRHVVAAGRWSGE